MTRTLDLTVGQSDAPMYRLSGLRAAINMDWLGYARDPGSPVGESPGDVRALFCEPYETLERTDRELLRRDPAIECYDGPVLPAADPAYPAFNDPIKCVEGKDFRTSEQTGTPPDTVHPKGYWLPFSIELPRDSGRCRDQNGEINAMKARLELRDVIEHAVLQQLWSGAIEPRSLSLKKIVRNESAATASGPSAALSTLRMNIEADLLGGYTLLTSGRAVDRLFEKNLIYGNGDTWRDRLNQRVQFGGQFDTWIPETSIGAAETNTVPAAGQAYMVAAGPIWFAVSEIRDRTANNPDHYLEAVKQDHFESRPYVEAMLWTRTHDVYAVLTDFTD